MDPRAQGRCELGEFFSAGSPTSPDDYDFFPSPTLQNELAACVRANVACFLASTDTPQPGGRSKIRGLGEYFFELPFPRVAGAQPRPIVFAWVTDRLRKDTVSEQLSNVSTGAPLVSADATRSSLAGYRWKRKAPIHLFCPFPRACGKSCSGVGPVIESDAR